MSGKFDPGTTDRRIIRKSIIDYIFWEESENREFLEALAQLIDSGIKRLDCFEAAEQMQIQNSELERKNMNYIKHKLPETREEWLAGRQKGLGGSDAGAILGLNPYKSAYTLWAEKCQLINSEVPDNEAMRVGRDLEDYVAKRFTEKTGLKVRKSGFSFQSEEHPFMLANVDRLIVGEKAGLECKTANALNKTDFKGGDIPPSYYAQCYHYMSVLGFDHWYMAVLVMGKGFYCYRIDRDEAEIQALIEAEEEFWAKVQNKEAPEIDWSESTEKTIQTLNSDVEPDAVEDLDYLKEVFDARNELDLQIKDATNKKKQCENRIKDALGTACKGVLSGYRVSFKPQESRRIDTGKLKKEYPDIAAACSITSASRPLCITAERS